jgi:hypothetical protein
MEVHHGVSLFNGVVGNFPISRSIQNGFSRQCHGTTNSQQILFLKISCMYLLRYCLRKLSRRSNGKIIGKHHVVGLRGLGARAARDKNDNEFCAIPSVRRHHIIIEHDTRDWRWMTMRNQEKSEIWRDERKRQPTTASMNHDNLTIIEEKYRYLGVP